MNIGLVPTLNPSFGGGHQYSLAMLEAVALLAEQRREGNTYTIFVRPEERELLPRLNSFREDHLVVYASLAYRASAWIKRSIGQGIIRKAVSRMRQHLLRGRRTDPDRVRQDFELANLLRKHQIDWVLYTGSDARTFESGWPYVMPIFDLEHRLQPEFPEVSADGEREEREYVYRNSTRRATLILAGSEAGKEDILNFYGCYGIKADQIKVLPYPPAPYLRPEVSASERNEVRKRYRLPSRYLFYPAQLWPHKNHLRLVQALGQVKHVGTDVHVVLCGTHSGAIRTQAFREMMREAHRLQVTEQIHHLGYVPNADMSALYAEAVALVMPTFIGPTIPVVEAWLFGCPVLTSDIPGLREQVGEAGLLVNPLSVTDIAEGMKRLWDDGRLCKELAQRGRQQLVRHSPDTYRDQLAQIIVEANHCVAQLQSGFCGAQDRLNTHAYRRCVT